MPTGKEIIERAATILIDLDHVRWPLAELADWINEGVKATLIAKPSAHSESKVLALVAGTLQTVSTTGVPTPLNLIKVVRNITSEGPPRVGGRIITPVDAETLDAQVPDWHDPTKVAQAAVVKHVIFDENNPLEFYVYPGNDGSGKVEVILSTLPAPLVADGDAADIESYDGDIGLPEPYSAPILDYVLFRAFAKDDLEGAPGRSASHFQLFATAVGLKTQVEGATSPNAKR
jgi:hypothetical protein